MSFCSSPFIAEWETVEADVLYFSLRLGGLLLCNLLGYIPHIPLCSDCSFYLPHMIFRSHPDWAPGVLFPRPASAYHAPCGRLFSFVFPSKRPGFDLNAVGVFVPSFSFLASK